MTKILITGGAGFIGGHLAVALAEDGFQVDVVDNFARGIKDRFLTDLVKNGRVRLHDRDLRRQDALADLGRDFAYIYHLAAIIGVQHVLQRPYDVLVDNVSLLANVIDFARRQVNLSRFLFTSTSEVYAGSLIHMDMPVPTPEDTPLALTALDSPRTSYMLSKIYGEAMCQASALPFSIVRPHNFYGPRMGLSHVIPELLKRAHEAPQGGRLEVYSADHRRAFCYIDDAIRSMRGIAENVDGLGATVNVGTGSEDISMGALAGIVCSVVGKRLEIIPLPPTPGSPTRRCPLTDRADALSGHRNRVSLAEGVARTWDWYRTHVFADGGESAL